MTSTPQPPPATGPTEPSEPTRPVLVIGDAAVAVRVCGALTSGGTRVRHLAAPDDRALVEALRAAPSGVVIAVRGDAAALRYALAVAHLDPRVRLVVTIFDRTVSERLRTLLPQARVTSPAEIAAASLAGPCLGPDVLAAWYEDGEAVHAVRADPGPDGGPWVRLERHAIRHPVPWRRVLPSWRVHDTGTRLMLLGLHGLVAVLLADWTWLVLSHHPPVDSFLEASRVVATVGPAAEGAEPAYAVFAGLAMLTTIMLAATFTAGLVDRMLGPRLVGIWGRNAAPRRRHVVVVGMGQVGLRLAAELLRIGVPVLGVERDRNAVQLRTAKALGVPVVTAHGGDRSTLLRVRVDTARALAAVGSDDLDNVAVAVAASAVQPALPVVLRAGEQEAIAETRSLLPVGRTRDVVHLAAAWVVLALREAAPGRLVATRGGIVQVDAEGVPRDLELPRADCGHGTTSP
ncbi:NAD-binding protein [Nocardioides sp. GY 10127]|uniref:NAD-binding protein n=1 Tax=Nocardioides sp. GY 10127 TaxID=2569762 RepID=UPI0010A88719|nr:NAD-binding protein [Nocardioides sp. GY 10127]TIC82628.1 portal protein [Nocardioides sp. GY 10127]